jgi:hypothetical protein
LANVSDLIDRSTFGIRGKNRVSREIAGLVRHHRTDIARTATFLPAATTYNTPTMTAEEMQSCRWLATLTGPRAEALLDAD